MHVIAKPALVAFWSMHPEAEKPLKAWHRIMESMDFNDFAALRAVFPSADIVGDLTVFNIGGNKWRLIAAIHYNRRKVFHPACADARGVRPGRLEAEMSMNQTASLPDPSALLQAWTAFKSLAGICAVRTPEDYERAMRLMDALLEEVGGDEEHPLADLLDYVGTQVKAYEDSHSPITESEPRDVLRYLMEERGLKQEDLADCAPQGRISDILSGRRGVSKELAKKLAARFGVRADLFL